MRRKWIKVLAAALCVVMAVPVIGSAAPLELEKECSLTVEALKPAPGNEDMVEDLAKADIVYDLYKVAGMVNEGGYYTYELTEAFKKLGDIEKLNGFVDAGGQLTMPRDPAGREDAKRLWDDLSQEAAKLALNIQETNGAEPGAGDNAAGGDTVQAGGLPVIGEIVGTDKPGENAFAKTAEGKNLGEKALELDNGLYLLIARGKGIETYITREYVVADTGADGNDPKPDEKPKEEKIVTVAYTDQHVYTFAPELISLPTKEPDADGIISTASSGDWIYDSTVYLKPGQHTRYGRLEIVKDLLTYESFSGQSEEATFVFQVEAELNGQSVYSDVKTLVFNGAGKDSVVIDKIPVGAKVTVTEVYSGASYTLEKIELGHYGQNIYPDGTLPDSEYAKEGSLDTREVENVVIEANRVASVKFTNNYDHRQTGGHGIVNRFEFNEEENQFAGDATQIPTNSVQNSGNL